MATATIAKMTNTVDGLRADHYAAEGTKAHAHAELREATDRRDQLLGALRPDQDRASLDRRERLRAQIELSQIHDRVDVLQLAADDADAGEESARLAVKQAIAAAAHLQRRQIVSRLARALLAARPHADALSALHLESPFAGDDILWVSLQSRTPTFESVLTHWLATMAEYGLLDEATLEVVKRSEAGALLPQD